jgi:hypothetical protein
MHRNHPSLLLYVGGNEEAPPSDINVGLEQIIQTLDPSRPYFNSSLAPGFGDGNLGHDGPYGIQVEMSFLCFSLSSNFIVLFRIPSLFLILPFILMDLILV